MNDVLAPLCERYGANLQTGMGEMSITATLALVHRLQQANKPARILYVSDFDPAGQSMPVAVSRKIEYFVRTLGFNLDIRLFPVVLTLEQVQYYQLPRTPIKETERRRGGFEAQHGEGAVELDALEALYPGQLEQVLSQRLDYYYDWTLVERVKEQRRALELALSATWQRVTQPYEADVTALRQEYGFIQQQFDTRMSAFGEQLRAVWQAMTEELDRYTEVVDGYPVPQAYIGEELGDGLFNTERDYIEQVESYKDVSGSHLGKGLHDELCHSGTRPAVCVDVCAVLGLLCSPARGWVVSAFVSTAFTGTITRPFDGTVYAGDVYGGCGWVLLGGGV